MLKSYTILYYTIYHISFYLSVRVQLLLTNLKTSITYAICNYYSISGVQYKEK